MFISSTLLQQGVCVGTICTDVKLPFGWLMVLVCFFLFLNYVCRGTQHFTGTVSNEATSEMGYPAWPAGRTCTIFQFRQWRPAKPSTGMSFEFFILDYAASEPSSELRFQQVQSTVRFSQSELLPFCQMEQLLLARTKKEFIYIGFPAQSSNFSCQTLGDCLCTPDAFHISNSIRYF